MNDQASLSQLKDWLRQCYAWHVAQGQNLLRMGSAKGLGLDASAADRPFPGSPGDTTVTTVAAAPMAAPGAAPVPAPALPGWLKSLLVATAAAATALGGSALLQKFNGSGAGAPLSPAPAQTPPLPAVKTAVDPLELEVQWWTDEKGQVHFGQPTPVNPAPAGRK